MKNKHYLLIILAFALAMIITYAPGIVVMGVLYLGLYLVVRQIIDQEDLQFINRLFVAGILVRLATLFALYHLSILTGGPGELIPDSRLYSLKAIELYKRWVFGERWILCDAPGELKPKGLVYVLALFYWLIDYQPKLKVIFELATDKMFNIALSVASAILIYQFTARTFNRYTARIAAVLAMFCPTLVLWSVTNIKEPLHIFSVAIIGWCLLKFNEKFSWYYLFLIILILWMFSTVRSSIVVVIITAIFISLCFNFKMKTIRKVTIVPLIMCVLFITWKIGYFGKSIIPIIITLPVKVATKIVASNYEVIKQGGSFYSIYDVSMLNPDNITLLNFLSGAIKGITFFSLVPFPWNIRSILQLLSLPQVLLWYLLIPFTIQGMIIAWRYRFRETIFIISYLVISTIGYGLFEGNVGSTLRHRDTLMIFYFIFAAVGIRRFLNKPCVESPE